MKWTELALNGTERLQFGGKHIGSVQRQAAAKRTNDLAVYFEGGPRLDLAEAADVSQSLENPRLFIIEGTLTDTFVTFGGEKAYWLTTAGALKSELPLFREAGLEEYWTTQFLQEPNGLIIVYESGILAIDLDLALRWHNHKFLNDHFVRLDQDALIFFRDEENQGKEWFVRLETGKVQNGSVGETGEQTGRFPKD